MTFKKTWTPEELNILREKYPCDIYVIEDVIRDLPHHSQNAIRCKASELNLHRCIPELPIVNENIQPRQLLSVCDSKSIYYILKEILFISLYDRSNSNNPSSESPKLLSHTEINAETWRKLGKIFVEDKIRELTFFLLQEEATTYLTLTHKLKQPESTIFRNIRFLINLGIITPGMPARSDLKKAGRKVTIYQTPDATPERILAAIELHRKLKSPVYQQSIRLAQNFLDDYPSGVKEVRIKDLRQYARGLGFRDPGITDLAANKLQEQGIKVWR